MDISIIATIGFTVAAVIGIVVLIFVGGPKGPRAEKAEAGKDRTEDVPSKS